MPAKPCAVPPESQVHRSLVSADFYDAYEIANLQASRSALQIWLDTASRTPRWIERAMDVRNALVQRLGLKNLGRLSDFQPLKAAADYQVGDRVGIFTLRSISDQEIVLGDSDKHLDVQLSVMKLDMGQRVVVSTVVHIHNTLGRAYMFVVRPMHRLIAPAMLSNME